MRSESSSEGSALTAPMAPLSFPVGDTIVFPVRGPIVSPSGDEGGGVEVSGAVIRGMPAATNMATSNMNAMMVFLLTRVVCTIQPAKVVQIEYNTK